MEDGGSLKCLGKWQGTDLGPVGDADNSKGTFVYLSKEDFDSSNYFIGVRLFICARCAVNSIVFQEIKILRTCSHIWRELQRNMALSPKNNCVAANTMTIAEGVILSGEICLNSCFSNMLLRNWTHQL